MDDEKALRWRGVIGATALLLAVVATAASLTWRTTHDVQGKFRDVEAARAAVLRYDEVEQAVGAEAFAEASYRRAPSLETRQALVAALAAVPEALDAFAGASPTDQAVAMQLRILHRRYSLEAERLLQPGGLAVVQGQDDRVAGPALTAMQALTDAAIAGHRSAAATAREQQKQALSRNSLTVPTSLFATLLAMVICWALILRQHRRLHRRARESEWASTHDPLTGLANRVVLWRELDRSLAEQRPDCAVLLIDLDGFKEVNDTYGHAAGDAVLVASAERLSAATGPTDVVARLGGDEYAVLVRPALRAPALAHALEAQLSQPSEVAAGVQVACGATIGTAFAQPGQDRVDLLRSADMAMYASKPNRRRRPAPHLQSVASSESRIPVRGIVDN